MINVTDKFGDWIKEGFEIYKNNLGILIVSFLMAFILSGVSFGVLFGPMTAGMVFIVFKLLDEKQPPPVMGDLFTGFNYFLPSLLFWLVWSLILVVLGLILFFIPCIGQLFYIVLALSIVTSLMFGFYFIVDQKLNFWDASMANFKMVKPSFFPFLGLLLVAGILGQLGSIACGIGVIVTMPLYFTILGVAYRDVSGIRGQPANEPPPQILSEPKKEPKQPPEMAPEQKEDTDQPSETPPIQESKPEQPESDKE